MKNDEIEKLAKEGLWKGRPLKGTLTETHISWVILSEEFVFKIKKPHKFSFLDFSTLEKRRYYCEREVKLNSRFTDIYLDVVPIHKSGDNFILGGNNPEPVDYAVRMKKVNSGLEMGKMLKTGRVRTTHLQKLASILSSFHAKAKVIETPFRIEKMKENFNDLNSVREKIGTHLGTEYREICGRAIAFSEQFLNSHRTFILERASQGFRRDLHGDFHSGNIFLTENPIIFDCIEFNDEMRQIDILDEIAFFCMDMEAHQHKDLSQQFLNFYQTTMKSTFSQKELNLFNYYKLYRANVRAKVNSLKAVFEPSQVKPYFDLMKNYISLRPFMP